MDAATRAELEDLRRRAYGPEADIRDDPVALARLGELEDQARGGATPVEPPEPEPEPEPEPAPVGTATLPEPDPAESDAPPAARPSRARSAVFRAGAGALAVVAVMAVWSSIDQSTAPAPTISLTGEAPTVAAPVAPAELTAIGILAGIAPDARELLNVTLDGSFGNFVDLPLDGDAPVFPTAQRLEWAAPLGEYYGWDLWIAGGTGAEEDDYCILIRHEDDVRANCAPASLRRYGALQVSVAAADIDPQERPAQMTDEQRIGFWWLDGGAVEIALGTFDGMSGSTTIEIGVDDGGVQVERRTDDDG